MSAPSLTAELRAVEKLAVQAGYRRAAHWIAKARFKQFGREGWELGACMWCEVDFGKRRKAVEHDMQGGPPVCAVHLWLLPTPRAASVAVLRDVEAERVTRPITDDLCAEELEVLFGLDLIDSRPRLTSAGVLALQAIDAAPRADERSTP